MTTILALALGFGAVMVIYLVMRALMSGAMRRSTGRGIAVLVAIGLIAGVALMPAFGAAAFVGAGLGLLVMLFIAGRAVRTAATKGGVGDPISAEEARRVLRGAGDEEAIDALIAAQRARENRDD